MAISKNSDSIMTVAKNFDVAKKSDFVGDHSVFQNRDLGLGISAQLVWLTPEVASAWKTMFEKNQRSLKKLSFESLKRDMLAGRFEFNGQPIIFNEDGFVADGRHRILAVIDTNVSILVLVVFGVKKKAYVTIDTIAPRQGRDALKSAGYKNFSVLSGASVLLRRYEEDLIGHSYLKLSPVAIQETVQEHPDLVRSAVMTVTCGKFCHAPSAVVFCHYIFSQIDQDRADDFFSKLGSGVEIKEGDVILSARRRFIENKFTTDEAIFLIFKAWNCYRKGTSSRLLRRGPTERLPEPI